MIRSIDYTKKRVNAGYKSIYLRNELIEQINDIAKEKDTSFNNIVVKMIEFCLQEGF